MLQPLSTVHLLEVGRDKRRLIDAFSLFNAHHVPMQSGSLVVIRSRTHARGWSAPCASGRSSPLGILSVVCVGEYVWDLVRSSKQHAKWSLDRHVTSMAEYYWLLKG